MDALLWLSLYVVELDEQTYTFRRSHSQLQYTSCTFVSIAPKSDLMIHWDISKMSPALLYVWIDSVIYDTVDHWLNNLNSRISWR